MIELNYSSTKGKEIYKKGLRYEGYTLEQVYARPSQAKKDAYNRCYEEYLNTKDRTAFSICSYNTCQFSCSWLGEVNGEWVMRYETAKNSYIVYLER